MRFSTPFREYEVTHRVTGETKVVKAQSFQAAESKAARKFGWMRVKIHRIPTAEELAARAEAAAVELARSQRLARLSDADLAGRVQAAEVAYNLAKDELKILADEWSEYAEELEARQVKAARGVTA